MPATCQADRMAEKKPHPSDRGMRLLYLIIYKDTPLFFRCLGQRGYQEIVEFGNRRDAGTLVG